MAQVSTKLNDPFGGSKSYDTATDKGVVTNSGGAIAATKYNGANFNLNEYRIAEVSDPIPNIADTGNAGKWEAQLEIKLNKSIASLITANQSIVFEAIKFGGTINATGSCFITSDGNVPSNYKGTASHAKAVQVATDTYTLTIPNLQKSIDITKFIEYKLVAFIWDNQSTDGNLTKIGFSGLIPKLTIKLL